MRKLFISLLILIMTASMALATYTYDYRTNSGYSTYGGVNNSTVMGTNYSTGKSWTTHYTSYGSSGTDSNGNQWNYNRNTGVYQNYGTGETRFHKGF